MTDDTEDRPSPAAEMTGMPRWMKILIGAVLVVVAVLIISKLAGVEHGPGMHGGSDAAPTTHTGPPAGVEGHTPPVDHAP